MQVTPLLFLNPSAEKTRSLGLLVLGGLWLVPALLAQTDVDVQPRNGLHWYNVTASLGYSSLALGGGYSSAVPSVGGDYFGWASTAIGYYQGGPNGSFSVTYVPSYSGQVRYSNLKSFNQDLTIHAARRLSAKAEWYLNAFGVEHTIQEYLFSGNALAQAAQDSDNLTAAQAAPPSLATTAQVILYGTRVLSFGATTGFNYRPTTRLRWNASVTGDQSQGRPNHAYPQAAFLPRTQVLRADSSLGYSVTPRTEIGLDAEAARVFGGYGRQQYYSGAVRLARKLAPQWYASGAVGVGASNYGSNSLAPTTATYMTDLSLAYRRPEQALVLSYNRYAGGFYGVNTRATDTYMAMWTWRTRNRRWSLQANGAYQTLAGGVLGGATITQAGGLISRGITRQVLLSLDYGFAEFSGVGLASSHELTSHAARLTLTWIPFLRDTPPLR